MLYFIFFDTLECNTSRFNLFFYIFYLFLLDYNFLEYIKFQMNKKYYYCKNEYCIKAKTI